MSERSKRLQSAVLLFALVLLIFLVTTILLSFLPQDLSDLQGRKEDGSVEAGGRNLERVLSNAEEQGITVTLSEEEINQWLGTKLAGQQEGLLKGQVSYKGTWIRLEEGYLDVIIEREAFNRPHTVAMKVEIEQLEESSGRMNSQIHWRGGRLGQMPVPQGYLLLVMNSFKALAEAMEPEVSALQSLLEGRGVVTIEEEKLKIEPRDRSEDQRLMQGFQ
ncbi:MAG: hypothetical protein Q7Q71_13625 [Verrucomicrobiota bacterium JB023]|nr:hypothetical protein [Verrucomicrobiota bacterium JB023]